MLSALFGTAAVTMQSYALLCCEPHMHSEFNNAFQRAPVL